MNIPKGSIPLCSFTWSVYDVPGIVTKLILDPKSSLFERFISPFDDVSSLIDEDTEVRVSKIYTLHDQYWIDAFPDNFKIKNDFGFIIRFIEPSDKEEKGAFAFGCQFIIDALFEEITHNLDQYREEWIERCQKKFGSNFDIKWFGGPMDNEKFVIEFAGVPIELN